MKNIFKIANSLGSEMIDFGIQQIVMALEPIGFSIELIDTNCPGHVDLQVLIDIPHGESSDKESFSLQAGTPLILTGSDEAGAMYGCFEIAEQVRNSGGISGIRNTKRSPHVDFRATKINLPWSSYRSGKVMTLHTEVMQTREFWGSYIDTMALNRFNVISFWNLHPFPYMIQPENYPGASSFSHDEFKRWQDLWRFIFKRCRERGIEPYILNWNIFVSKVLEKKWQIDYSDSEYYIGPGDTSEQVKKYNRECITQLINEYEDLAGFGVSLGERMEGMTPSDRADWIKEVVIKGIKEAKRPIKFIHRAPFTADPMEVRRVLEESELPSPSYVEYKFNWSHGHSPPRLSMTHDVGDSENKPKIDDRYWNPAPTHHKMLWTVRNEDFFILRWGQSDFIREHIGLNIHDYVGGYIIGSEGYIPGEDYSQKDEVSRDWAYAFQKQWLFYMLWGRLLYNPNEKNEVFESEFETRYKNDMGKKLFTIYRLVSSMPLRLASFYGATWDYTLYSEGFIAPFKILGYVGDTESFISIDEFIAHPTLDDNLLSITDYTELLLKKRDVPEGKKTPLMLAEDSEKDGREALTFIKEIKEKLSELSGSLESELADAQIWAHLSLYLTYKLRAGVRLHSFRIKGIPEDKEMALQFLEEGLEEWKKIVEITKNRYKPVPYIDRAAYGFRLNFHWKHNTRAVQRDIFIVKKASKGVFPYRIK